MRLVPEIEVAKANGSRSRFLSPVCGGALALTALVAVTDAVTAVTRQDPVFRTSVDLVTIDATVLDGDGQPASGLGAADFVVKVDGRARPIVSAQFVAEPRGPRRAQALYARHFSSNEHADAGRLVVIAVDEAHIRRIEGRAALGAAAAFVDRLDPLDRAAVSGLTRAGTIQFTRDRAALKQRLEGLAGQTDAVFLQFNLGLSEAVEIADGGRARLAEVVLRECGRSLSEYTSPARAADDAVGGGRDACPEQLEQEARAVSQHARSQARISLTALEGLVDGLKRLDGPKTIVLLSEGMVLDPRLNDVSELAALAKEARVAIYVLHMETPLFEAAQDRPSPSWLRDLQLRGDGLARLAGATRGAVFRLVGSDPAPFDRVAREISGYYLLAVEADDADRDGRVHRIEVSLARGSGLIRARSAFRMPAVAANPRTREQELVALLRGTGTATELPVRVATYAYADTASPQLRIVVSSEVDAGDGPAAHVLLGYVLIDAAGVIAASGAQLATAGTHAFSAVVRPGKYALRVAALDLLGRRGLVERPFVAAIESAGDLRASDLILAPTPAEASTPLAPLIHRVRAPRITANVEVYATAAAAAHVQVEFQLVPAGVVEGGTIADPPAPPVLRVPATIVRGGDGLVVARAVLDLRTLQAGTYVARALITAHGTPPAQVSRPFTYEP